MAVLLEIARDRARYYLTYREIQRDTESFRSSRSMFERVKHEELMAIKPRIVVCGCRGPERRRVPRAGVAAESRVGARSRTATARIRGQTHAVRRLRSLSASTLRALHAQTSNGTIGTTLYLAISP